VSQEASVKTRIVNRLGLHARPATAFVDLAAGYGCQVAVRKDDMEVDGTSIMQMMMLAATQGTELEIRCRGERAEQCADALKGLVDSGFDEE